MEENVFIKDGKEIELDVITAFRIEELSKNYIAVSMDSDSESDEIDIVFFELIDETLILPVEDAEMPAIAMAYKAIREEALKEVE